MLRNFFKGNRKEGYIKPTKRDLTDMLQATHLSNEEKFNNILEFARKILDENIVSKFDEHPIFDFIRILGRGLQSDYMKYAFYYDCDGGEHNVPMPKCYLVGFDENEMFIDDSDKLIEFYDFKKEVKSNKKVNLSTDLVLPCPWNRDRLFNNITEIGRNRASGVWKQDRNHEVEVWLPMGIAWVRRGNHSITMGIMQGAELEPEHYYDISKVYKYIKCDGKNFIRIKTNSIIDNEIIAPVTNIDFAAIFEIGRLLVERDISFIN